MFDEADIDAAIARFDELSRPAPRLENAASRVLERYLAHFAARDWDAMAEMLADDFSADDRRRVVNAGVRRGRDAEIANVRADRRGRRHEHDVDSHRDPRGAPRPHSCRYRGSDERAEAFHNEVLDIVEINADDRIAAQVMFDSTTSTPPSRSSTPGTSPAKRPPTRTHGRSSRAPMPRSTGANSRTTPDWVNIDHRRRYSYSRPAT